MTYEEHKRKEAERHWQRKHLRQQRRRAMAQRTAQIRKAQRPRIVGWKYRATRGGDFVPEAIMKRPPSRLRWAMARMAFFPLAPWQEEEMRRTRRHLLLSGVLLMVVLGCLLGGFLWLRIH